MLLGAAYFLTTVRIDHAEDSIRASGIEIIQELSKLISLPLLDSNAQIIHALLVYAAKRDEMIHASVRDHQNKIVTLTGAEKLIPSGKPETHFGAHVSFWEGELPNHKKIFNLASDVTYGGTKIGRIQIAFSGEGLLRIRDQFVIVAVTSGVILLLVIVGILWYPRTWPAPVKLMEVFRREHRSDNAIENSLITCPLCGAQKPFSKGLFKRSNFGRLLIVRPLLNQRRGEEVAHSKGMRLSDLAKRDDLSWLKRQIMVRCAEIVKRLAT
jgi:hypothetical protein